MAKEQYTSPMIAVRVLYDEDIITASTFQTEVNGKDATVTVGDFNTSWLG